MEIVTTLTSSQFQSILKKKGKVDWNGIKEELNLKDEVKKVKLIKKPSNKNCEEMKLLLRIAGIEYVEEFKFSDERKFRFDVVILPLNRKLAIEFEGLTFDGKGGHQNSKAYTSNTDKYNLAATLGWTVLRYTYKNFHNVVDDFKKII